ncbi:MAG: putative O-methyltransferase [Myxococcota bacterium]|nr:putative O-methyltransferase [Myxococcota bacterium]
MILNPGIQDYLLSLPRKENQTFQDMEALAREKSFPIAGPDVGALLHMLVSVMCAQRIFEMGSGFGYSTCWLAEAAGAGGNVIYADASLENCRLAREFLLRAGLESRVSFRVGDARDILREYPGPFDLIFVDIEKEGYPDALELAIPRLRIGGLLVVDDVLWSGKVIEESPDDTTRAILRFNKMAATRDDIDTILLPLRDGVSISRRLH